MATRHNNFGGTRVHTNDALGDFENFQRGNIEVGHNLDIGEFYFIKSLDAWIRNQSKIVRPDLVEITFLADIFRELAV